jgi:hypothetical protein
MSAMAQHRSTIKLKEALESEVLSQVQVVTCSTRRFAGACTAAQVNTPGPLSYPSTVKGCAFGRGCT